MATVHEDRYTLLIISRSVLLRVRNVSDKSFRENQNTGGLQYLVDADALNPSCLVYNTRQRGRGLHDVRAHQQLTHLVFLPIKLSDVTQLCTVSTSH
jgi:hypothetical protein